MLELLVAVGMAGPSIVLRLACRLIAQFPQQLGHHSMAVQWPSRLSSFASSLLQVQRKGDFGSPRVTGPPGVPNPASRSRQSTLFFRPPPGRRTLPVSCAPARVGGIIRLGTLGASASSLIPWVIARRDMPVLRATSQVPPKTIAKLSLAATNRLMRLF
jgi:hypothetical protein